MAGKPNEKGASGGSGFIIALVLVMLIGGGAGFAFGFAFQNAPSAGRADGSDSGKPPPAPVQPHPARDSAESAKQTISEVQLQVVPLDPVLVNLAGKDRSWIRLEGSVAFTATPDKDRAILLAHMAEDIAGYLKGSSVSQLQSAAGLEALREDLSELVQLRSKNRAVRFILRSLAIE